MKDIVRYTDKAIIDFPKEYFNKAVKNIKAGNGEDGNCLGHIDMGAVDVEIVAVEVDGNFMLDVNFYLLKKNALYGETPKGTPYTYKDGIYLCFRDNYEETLKNILNEVNEYIRKDAELIKGIEETEMTWEKER